MHKIIKENCYVQYNRIYWYKHIEQINNTFNKQNPSLSCHSFLLPHEVSHVQSTESTLAQTHTWSQGWTFGEDFGGQRSRSLWPQILWNNIFKNAGIFVKFSINLHLDSRVNWLDFGGQRSVQPYILWGHSDLVPCWALPSLKRWHFQAVALFFLFVSLFLCFCF